MIFKAVCIWGWPLHSHTHSYIHNGFFRAAKHLGLPTFWKDNVECDASQFPAGTVFITEAQVDSHIPLRKDCFYVLHNCDQKKFEGMEFVKMQCLLDSVQGDAFLGKPWLVRENEVLFMPWATDLLPDEIQTNMDSLESIWNSRGTDVHFVGYFIEDPWHRVEKLLSQKGLKLVKCGGYGLPNVSVEENMKRMQRARLAPAVQSEEQVARGYLPCRILKNISYGALGVTNNPKVRRMFGELFEDLVFASSLKDALDKGLGTEMDFKKQRRLMKHIKDNHTYVNRLQELEKMFQVLENKNGL